MLIMPLSKRTQVEVLGQVHIQLLTGEIEEWDSVEGQIAYEVVENY